MDRSPLSAAGEEPSRPSGNFGKLSFGFLVVSLLSGAALVPVYDPSAPLASLERIVGGIPWGSFFRALHAYSSFALLLAILVHLGQVAWKRTERQLSAGAWWRSVATLPLIVLALLGGFVLRGDAEARAAAAVWRGLADSIPVIGRVLSVLFLGSSPESVGAVALHHAGSVSILVLLFTIEHGGKTWPGSRPAILAALVSICAAGLFVLPLGAPPPGHGLLLGPWALIGLQGALVDLPTAFGWIAPLLFVVLVGAVRGGTGRVRTALLGALAVGALSYLGFTARMLVLAAR